MPRYCCCSHRCARSRRRYSFSSVRTVKADVDTATTRAEGVGGIDKFTVFSVRRRPVQQVGAAGVISSSALSESGVLADGELVMHWGCL